MKAIYLFAAIAAFAMNTNVANASEYNKPAEGDKTVTVVSKAQQKEVVSAKSDEPTSKVVYNTDEQGRVTSKVIYQNTSKGWQPVAAYSLYYGEEENVLTYAAWDKNTKSFTRNAQQQRYNATDYPVLMTLPE